MYKLLAFDYDGTAAVDGGLPSERVRRALAAAAARGAILVLATGRPYVSAARYAQALDLDAPIICFQGAMVREIRGERRVLFVEPTPADAMCEILNMADSRNLELSVYGDDLMYVVDRGRPGSFFDKWFGAEIQYVRSYAEVCDLFSAMGKTPLKGLFVGDPDSNDAFRDELDARFAGRLVAVRSSDMFVEVHSPRASKGQALRFLAQYFGLSQEETLAVGDSGNDCSMIEWAGLGVAMGNAQPEVLAVADVVAPTVSEDGLADVIERYLLSHAGV